MQNTKTMSARDYLTFHIGVGIILVGVTEMLLMLSLGSYIKLFFNSSAFDEFYAFIPYAAAISIALGGILISFSYHFTGVPIKESR